MSILNGSIVADGSIVPDLQQVTDIGNSTTNDILVSDGISNSTSISKALINLSSKIGPVTTQVIVSIDAFGSASIKSVDINGKVFSLELPVDNVDTNVNFASDTSGEVVIKRTGQASLVINGAGQVHFNHNLPVTPLYASIEALDTNTAATFITGYFFTFDPTRVVVTFINGLSVGDAINFCWNVIP